MKLEATITGTRMETRGGYMTGKNEDYTLSAVEAEGGHRVLANILRAMADDIDPLMPPLPLPVVD